MSMSAVAGSFGYLSQVIISALRFVASFMLVAYISSDSCL